MWKEPPVTHSAERFAWHVMPPTNRIVLAELLLDERVTKQAQDGDALLHGGVG